jgi:hypothetical protein
VSIFENIFVVKRRQISYFSSQPHRRVPEQTGFAPKRRSAKQRETLTKITKQHRRNQMKFNKLTVGLAAVGVVSLASAASADEMTKVSQLQTALNNTTISGYVDTAAQWNPGTDQGASDSDYGYGYYRGNYPQYSFAKNDGFSLNAVDIAIDKPEDETPWAAGYHIETMYGADTVGVPLVNHDYGYTYSPYYYGTTGFTVRQAYLALRTPIGSQAIDWKVGVFDTIIGYESSSDPLNPNYSRSYGYTIEPTTHTGVLGTYKINDMITVQAGVANSAFWNSFVPTATYESQKAYMGAIALTAPDSFGWAKGATLNLGVVDSTDSQAYGIGSQTSWYAGLTIPTPLAALKLGASFDYLDNRSADHDTFGLGTGETWVAALYSTYQINDKASVNLRGEYGQDDTGLLYGAIGPDGRDRNSFEEVTATLQYNLWANVLSRLEFRWDHVEDGKAFGYTQGGFEESSGEPNRSNDFMLAANLIYQF